MVDAKGKPKANKTDDVDNSIDALRYALTIAMKDYDRIGSAVSKPDKQPIVHVETSLERKRRMFIEALARKKNRKV